ncbi:MAG: FAD-dependent oxidoreductase [Clostridiales bacterium]|nr:FAD-dependent oxidoreductase [Clostridiales bacterium]
MRYSREVPLHSEWDVIVCGAGPSGLAAAVTAARLGMRVMLLERYGSVGGCLTLGNVSTIMGSVAPGTIRDEMAKLLHSADVSTGIDCDEAKGVLIEWLAQEQVTFRLQTPVVDALMQNGTIQGVYVLTQQGIALMRGKVVIDATGDGFVSAMAGAQVMVGRDGDGLVQPSSIMYTIDGVDPDCTLVCNHEEHYTTFPDGREYLALCHQAAKDGRLPPSVSIVRLYATGVPGERLVNATQANGVCVLSDGDAEQAEIVLRRQIRQVNHFLRAEVPGFAGIRVRTSASTLGVRESRRIAGRYQLCAEDLLIGRRFEDVVVHNANFPIDIHNPSGGGQAETEGCPHKAQPYDIPMRALQPLGVEGLVLCGRCISGSHRAHASYRVMNIAMAIGQAAGTMAAVSVQGNIPVSELEAAAVQSKLREQGCRITDA